jgi:hypothetical protein
MSMLVAFAEEMGFHLKKSQLRVLLEEEEEAFRFKNGQVASTDLLLELTLDRASTGSMLTPSCNTHGARLAGFLFVYQKLARTLLRSQHAMDLKEDRDTAIPTKDTLDVELEELGGSKWRKW